MRKEKRRKILNTVTVFCVAVVFALACPAQATPLDTVEISHSGYGAKDLVKIWGGGLNGVYGYGGVYMFEKTAGTGQGDYWPDGPIGGFCMDLSEGLSGSTRTYDVVMPEEGPVSTSFSLGPMGTEKADYLAELWYEHFNPAWMGSAPFTDDQNREAGAFAVAVWEIIYEDLPSLTSLWDVTADGTDGDMGFRCEYADTGTANSWLHALGGGPKAQLRALVYDGEQDMLVAVPEPATVGLLGFGSVALFCTPGKRKKM